MLRNYRPDNFIRNTIITMNNTIPGDDYFFNISYCDVRLLFNNTICSFANNLNVAFNCFSRL